MQLDAINKLAEEIGKKYNPERVSPFPYGNIEDDRDELEILLIDLEDGISGAINYDPAERVFSVLINKNKPETRRYFTVAHELGHYFLHRDTLQREELIMDGENTLGWNRLLFRLDDSAASEMEAEANAFAAALIMPTGLVIKAWDTFKNIEECAKIFNVSPSAMSIRLEKLGLVAA